MIRKITEAFIAWCSDNSAAAKLERTIVQGLIGVLVGGLTTGEWTGALIVGAIVAILTPIQAAIGGKESSDA